MTLQFSLFFATKIPIQLLHPKSWEIVDRASQDPLVIVGGELQELLWPVKVFNSVAG